MLDTTEIDRQTAMLTEKQRSGLINSWRGWDRRKKSYHRGQIVDRVRSSLVDFGLLNKHLSDAKREAIFTGDRWSDEYRKLLKDTSAAIEFLYVGLGGESEFKRPLKRGVARGEVTLGNVDHPLDVEPRFSVDPNMQSDRRAAVDAIEAGEWDRLYPWDVLGFLRVAHEADAIDFDAVRERIDSRERTRKKAEELAKKRRKPVEERDYFDST